MEGLPKNSSGTSNERKSDTQSFSDKLKEKSKSVFSSIGKAGRRTFLAGALATTALTTVAQVKVAPKENPTEQMSLAELKELAQTDPFTVLKAVETLDSLEQKEVLPIMEEALLVNEPSALLYFFSENKNYPDIYDADMVNRAFEASVAKIQKGDKDEECVRILVNAGLLADNPNGDDIFKAALKNVSPAVIIDEEYRSAYLKYPHAAELVKPYVKKAIEGLVQKGHWDAIGPSLKSFIDEPWAEPILKEWNKNNMGVTSFYGDVLMSKPFGQEIVVDALKKDPISVQSLSISQDKMSPALESQVIEALQYSLEDENFEKLNSYAFIDQGRVFRAVPGGDTLYKKLASKLATYLPSLVLDNIVDSKFDWLGEETKKELLQMAAESADARYVFKHAQLFSAEPYGRKVIEKAAQETPGEVINHATQLIPREAYVDIIRDAVNLVVVSDPDRILYNPIVIDLIAVDRKEHDVLLEKVVRATAEHSGGEHTIVSQYKEFAEKPYAKEILESALLQMPQAVVSATGKVKGEMESSQNPYIQKLFSLSNDPYIAEESEYFTRNAIYSALQYITEKDVTVDASFAEPANLFRAYMYTKKSSNPIGLNGVEKNLRLTSNSLIQKINRMHDEPDSVRFASVSEYDPEILYTLATYGEQEAFTSTFNGLFNRTIDGLKKEQKNGYTFLEEMSFMQARTFIRECASYNRLDEFLNTMAKEDQRKLLEWFISGINSDKEVLTEGVVIADVISSVEDKSILDVFGATIQKKYAEGVASKNRSIEVAYGLLGTLYAQQTGNTDAQFGTEGHIYHIEQLGELSKDSLFGPNKTSIHRYYFYNDSDGQGSFQSFTSQYAHDPSWNFEDKGEYVVVSSVAGEKIKIFANKPFAENGNEIDSILGSKNTPINVIVHRGHSFHAEKTVAEIPSTAALVSLGSCGGYRLLDGVLNHSPSAHVISTKGTGTMKVNDPILKAINEEIRAGHSIKWAELWTKFEATLGDNPNFKNYVPPNKNLGLMFMSAYRNLIKEKN